MNEPTHPVKLLFICSRNQWRSPTAEQLYRSFPGYLARSAGTSDSARVKVNAGHIGWADWIFVMEKRHRDLLEDRFPAELEGKHLVCLHIPDEFQYLDPDLITLLKSHLSEFIPVPG
jgi:predicted protein tyrosine phosphatase